MGMGEDRLKELAAYRAWKKGQKSRLQDPSADVPDTKGMKESERADAMHEYALRQMRKKHQNMMNFIEKDLSERETKRRASK